MIIGTAGHIDHGKSALVTALTGVAMDRLAEEQRRGITIDLNFAPLRFEGLPPAGIVDVPGHEDFVRTMVAGASGIDLVLLVVDAVQGPEPQTWEHLAIVEQLAVPRGIPVVTKADLSDPDWLELVVAELEERLQSSPVAFEPVAVVSAVTGRGIPELATRLREIVAAHRRERPADGFRMPVDRAFSIAGVGTVVTGTPWSGALHLGDAVTLLPGGLSGRVRSLEAYGASVSLAQPGARTAIGIAGIERNAIHRGETLVDGKLPWIATTALDVELALLPGMPALRRQLRVRVHLGTAEVLARVYPRAEGAAPGKLLARLALEAPVIARGGDRLVLRSYSPVATIGGGVILDPAPPRRAPWPAGLNSDSLPPRVSALVTRRAGGVLPQELPLLAGVAAPEIPTDIVPIADRYLPAALVATLRTEATRTVEQFHRKSPALPGLSLETLRRGLGKSAPEGVVNAILEGLVGAGTLTLSEGLVALPGFKAALGAREELLVRALTALEAAGLEPPSVTELERQLGQAGLREVLRFAAQEGKAVAVEPDRYYVPAALERFVTTVKEVAVKQAVTPAALRESLNLSRKYLIPLLEWADRAGITRRIGDTRVLV